MRRVRTAVGAVGMLAVVVLALPIVGLLSAADPDGETRVFLVEPGEPVSAVIRHLGEKDLLPKRPLFGPRVLILVARLTGADRDIKSGEYEHERAAGHRRSHDRDHV